MPVAETKREVCTLVAQVSSGEIQLPEFHRRFVWSPARVAKLIESLYCGYPTGNLLFWRTSTTPTTIRFSVDGTPGTPVIQPLYLLDGQQRLTALHRVMTDHPNAQVVFNIETEEFQIQNRDTLNDPLWVKVGDLLAPAPDVFGIVEELRPAVEEAGEREIYARLNLLTAIRHHEYRLDVLDGSPYEEAKQIYVRVNDGGQHLDTIDICLADLSAKWPGIVAQMEDEAAHWADHGYAELDTTFLACALACAVLGRELSQWSYPQLAAASHASLEQGWRTVRRGLKHLVQLLKNNLQISHGSLYLNIIVLLPAIIYLGERPDEPMDSDATKGLLYWILVATMQSRYRGAADTKLGQDIGAARLNAPVREMLANLGIIGTRVEVTPRELAGHGSNSPYFLLSFLVCQANGAQDWWSGSNLAGGGEGVFRLEHHHIHPRATLTGYPTAEINDLANLAFISAKANNKISDRSPADYFPEVGDTQLAAHHIPLKTELRAANAYRDFLAARRESLASAMTALLNRFRPSWLDAAPTGRADPLTGCALRFAAYESSWDIGKIMASAECNGATWMGYLAIQELESSLNAADESRPSDIYVNGMSIPVQLEGENVQIKLGPFLVIGTAMEWKNVLDRIRADARPLSECPITTPVPWDQEPITFPVTSAD